MSPEPEPGRRAPSALRALFMTLGLLFTGLGFVGIFLPVLPTTPFLILAAACFTRSSARLEGWLLGHPRLGPPLRDWRARGAIPLRGKIASALGMIAGFGFFWFGAHPGWPEALLVLGLMLAGAAYVWSRPS